MALSEIVFLTKIENIVNGNLILYNWKDNEDSQKISSGATVVSRPYTRQQFRFMPGYSFDIVLINMEFCLGKTSELHFPARTFNPSIIGFKGISDSKGIYIGYNRIPDGNKFMKMDDTKAYYG